VPVGSITRVVGYRVADRTRSEESAMAAKPHIVVEPRPDGRWARQENGTRRAASLHATQRDAVDRARAQAKHEGAELVVKGRDGRITRRDSFGNDPRNVRG
jgi:hypothetical protein